jgi:membrane-associated phospholipid phosphatase
MSCNLCMSSVYKSISLYEFVAASVLALSSLGLQNVYLFLILCMLLSKTIVVKILKKSLFKTNGRPSEATDCNILNQGGPVGGKPGFPSGHTAMAVSLFTFLFIQWYKRKTNTTKSIPNVLIVTCLFAILVPIARVGLKCHTVEQVQGGVVFGMIWGSLFGLVIDPTVERLFERYRVDKEKILYGLF